VNEQCLAVCRECTQQIGRPAVQAFATRAARDAWVLAHGVAAHQVVTLDGWPAPHIAYRRAFGANT
jgi:hypothetical protein